MNKNPFWIAFYFGQQCILHPDTGRWTLVGYFDGQVVCTKHDEHGEEYDTMIYYLEEVQFVLKFCNPYLIKALSKLPGSFNWMKSQALQGYWMFYDSDFKQVIFEK